MSTRLLSLSLLCGLCAAVLPGCGDDGGGAGDDGSSGGTTATTVPSSTSTSSSTSTQTEGTTTTSTTTPATSTTQTQATDSSGSSTDDSTGTTGEVLPGAVVVYVSFDSGISSWSVDEVDGALEQIERVDLMAFVGPTAIDPAGQFMYAAQVGDQEITAFVVASDGTLSEIETIGVGHGSVYLAVDATGSFLLSTSYNENLVRVYPIEGDGSLGPPTAAFDVQQNPHSIVVDPTNTYVMVPTLGSNLVEQYLFDANAGTLTPNTPPSVNAPAGAGPRHLAFSPDGANAYVGNELNSTVSRYRVSATGTLTLSETISTLPSDFNGANTVADTHISPDGSTVYVSNRGHDSIAIFPVDAAGILGEPKHVATQARPRDFHLTPDGRFLYAAGQDSGMLASYTIEDDGGLTPGAVYDVGAGAQWVLAAQLPAR